MDELRALCDEHGLLLIEDMAQSIGARYLDGRPCGTAADLACMSFFSKKQLCVGEGGAVLTADQQYADTVRLLRSHAMTSGTWDRHRGHQESYDIIDLGYNYRLDEPRAALGLARIRRLASDIEARRQAVGWYRDRLYDVPGLTLMWDAAAVARSSHFAFPVLTGSREARVALRSDLADRGIQTTRYPALHALTEYAEQGTSGGLEIAESAADRHVCLPLWAQIEEATVDRVCTSVIEIMERLR